MAFREGLKRAAEEVEGSGAEEGEEYDAGDDEESIPEEEVEGPTADGAAIFERWEDPKADLTGEEFRYVSTVLEQSIGVPVDISVLEQAKQESKVLEIGIFETTVWQNWLRSHQDVIEEAIREGEEEGMRTPEEKRSPFVDDNSSKRQTSHQDQSFADENEILLGSSPQDTTSSLPNAEQSFSKNLAEDISQCVDDMF